MFVYDYYPFTGIQVHCLVITCIMMSAASSSLQNYIILLENHYICLKYVVSLFQIYELSVLETKPGKAVSIIETDMNVSIPNKDVKYTIMLCAVFIPAFICAQIDLYNALSLLKKHSNSFGQS